MTTSKPAIDDKIHVYQDRRDEWRWRRTAPNGKIVGASSEGYHDRSAAVANAKRIQMPVSRSI